MGTVPEQSKYCSLTSLLLYVFYQALTFTSVCNVPHALTVVRAHIRTCAKARHTFFFISSSAVVPNDSAVAHTHEELCTSREVFRTSSRS